MDFLNQMTEYLLSQPKVEAPAKPANADASASAEDNADFQTLLSQKKKDLAAKDDGQTAAHPEGENEGEQPAVGENPADQEQDGLSGDEQVALAAMAAAQLIIVIPAEEQTAPPVDAAALAAVQTAPATPVVSSGEGAKPDAPMPQQAQGAPEQTASPDQATAPIKTQSTGQQPTGDRRQSEESPLAAPPRQTAGAKSEQPVAEAAAAPLERPLFQDLANTPVKVGNGIAPETAQGEDAVKSQMLRSLSTATANGESSVRISLQPESLGTVTVELSRREDGTLNVLLHADNLRTQSILEKNAGSLQTLLTDRTDGSVQVQVERQQESQSGRQDLYDQEGQQDQQGQQRQRPRQQQQEESDFLQQLRLGLIPADGEAS